MGASAAFVAQSADAPRIVTLSLGSDPFPAFATHPAGPALVHQQAQVASRRVLHGDGQVVRRQEHLLRRIQASLMVAGRALHAGALCGR